MFDISSNTSYGQMLYHVLYIYNTNTVCMQGGDEDGEGGGSDIGALLGNLGPLISGLSGVSIMFNNVYMILNII